MSLDSPSSTLPTNESAKPDSELGRRGTRDLVRRFERRGETMGSTQAPKVDRLDLRILAALAQNARHTIADMCKKVGLSATPCSARVERMEASGVIIGYQTDVDLERLADLSLYWVTLALKTWTASSARAIETLIQNSPYIVGCDRLFGAIDYIIWVYAQSIPHYHSIMEPFEAFELDYTTYPVSKRIMRPHLDGLLAELAKR
jgi:Lrp/AsnC family transcriptional regulator, regulator of ectoine-degradation genes